MCAKCKAINEHCTYSGILAFMPWFLWYHDKITDTVTPLK
jgi:hypothetical protein